MDEYMIKVTPEYLLEVSGEVVGKVQKVQQAFENLSCVIESSNQHWQGNGNSEMCSAYQKRKDDYERIFNEITEHVINLQIIAGVYRETENKNLDVVDILPGDVII